MTAEEREESARKAAAARLEQERLLARRKPSLTNSPAACASCGRTSQVEDELLPIIAELLASIDGVNRQVVVPFNFVAMVTAQREAAFYPN
jgi:hypothetical protein